MNDVRPASTNWCCWPFSLCCGEVTPEQKPLLHSAEDKGENNKTPETQRKNQESTTPKAGGTPTRQTTVQEHRGQVSTEEFV